MLLQIGCGDLFENKVVDEFNDCPVTRKGCVPQKADEGRFHDHRVYGDLVHQKLS